MDPGEEVLIRTDDEEKLRGYLVSIQGKLTDLEKSKSLKRNVTRHDSSTLCKFLGVVFCLLLRSQFYIAYSFFGDVSCWITSQYVNTELPFSAKHCVECSVCK